jgi:hypothetical protein
MTSLWSACDDPNSPSNNVPSLIKGVVTLRNAETIALLADHSGVNVMIEGTSYSATTDASGAYTLANVPPGIYVLTYTKQSFDTVLVKSVEYSGVGVEFLDSVTLYSNSLGQLTLDSLVNVRASQLIGNYSWYDSLKIVTLYDGLNDSVIGYDTIVYFLAKEAYFAHDSIIIFFGRAANIPTNRMRIELKGDYGLTKELLCEFPSTQEFYSVLRHRSLDDHKLGQAGWEVRAKAKVFVANDTQLLESNQLTFKVPR